MLLCVLMQDSFLEADLSDKTAASPSSIDSFLFQVICVLIIHLLQEKYYLNVHKQTKSKFGTYIMKCFMIIFPEI